MTGYLDGVGVVSTDRLSAPTKIAGASRREKRRLAALEARRNYLAVKLQDASRARLQYERQELSALDWAIEIIQMYFDHLNAGECELVEQELADLHKQS